MLYIPKSEVGAKFDLIIDIKGAGLYILELKYNQTEFTLDKTEAEQLLRQKIVLAKIIGTTRSIFVLLLSSQKVKLNQYLDETVDKVIPVEILL